MATMANPEVHHTPWGRGNIKVPGGIEIPLPQMRLGVLPWDNLDILT